MWAVVSRREEERRRRLAVLLQLQALGEAKVVGGTSRVALEAPTFAQGLTGRRSEWCRGSGGRRMDGRWGRTLGASNRKRRLFQPCSSVSSACLQRGRRTLLSLVARVKWQF